MKLIRYHGERVHLKLSNFFQTVCTKCRNCGAVVNFKFLERNSVQLGFNSSHIYQLQFNSKVGLVAHWWRTGDSLVAQV